ncbi:MAG: hypothetical protein ACLP05_04775 [Candidatus Kryptoniota bacterium]
MELTKIPEDIRIELMQAQAALSDGNDGKARVCARRAVGKAFQLSKYSKEIGRSVSSTESLKLIAAAAHVPGEVRDAAERLSVNVLEKGISRKPLDDALAIIAELLEISQ